MATARQREESCKWVQAAEFYKAAGENFQEAGDTAKYQDCYRKAARCLKEGTKHIEAAELFEAMGDYLEAGACYIDEKLLKKAFGAYCRGGFHKEASSLARTEVNQHSPNFEFLDYATDLLCKEDRFGIRVDRGQVDKDKETVIGIASALWDLEVAGNSIGSTTSGRMKKIFEYLEKADPTKTVKLEFMIK